MSQYKKKLIEVALPLEAINRESAHEKSVPRRGHPATVHLWWARRPLAACRAVLFASIVDDPSAHPEEFPSEDLQEAERQRLFGIIEELVKWENAANETVLSAARAEIQRSTDGNPPPVLDPFCGGGSIPLEAQRLGLEAHASDLNPVAVLITKALVEIPPRFAGLPPVNPDAQAKLDVAGWSGAQGLAGDVRYYGRWMRDEAERRIGHLYPKVKLDDERGGGEATAVAWLWARTVKCPNPACGADIPLVRSFALSSKKGRETWIEPIPDLPKKTVRFEIRTGSGVTPDGTAGRQGAQCLICGSTAPLSHVRAEAQAGRMSVTLLAVVAEGRRGRTYLDPSPLQAEAAALADPPWGPEELVTTPSHDVDRLPMYGMRRWRDAFTARQLTFLTTLSDLVSETSEKVLNDAEGSWARGGVSPSAGVTPADYAEAVATYLAFSIDKLADWSSSICSWIHSIEGVRDTFARQAIPMVWDFVEINPLSTSVGNFANHVEWVADGLAGLAPGTAGSVAQLDAAAASAGAKQCLIATDPPYYDNVGYADLSDFFYVWLRRTLRGHYPDLFSTLLTPKAQELIASPNRHEASRKRAKEFFEAGLGAAFAHFRSLGDPEFPMTVYYAFKQAEGVQGAPGRSVVSTGWETMLSGLLGAGFAVTGTWPIRSERAGRTVAVGTNALASSVVLVCRQRPQDAPLASRREFLSALHAELPRALRRLQNGNIAPVDLAQASIGPGMSVFSQYSKVMESDGSEMTVRTALGLINRTLDEILTEQEGEFDADTRWAVSWFEQVGTQTGEFGAADTLSRAKGTSVEGMVRAGFLEAKGGKVRLLRRDELDEGWNPATDKRLTVWEMTQHLIRSLDDGEEAAGALARQLGSYAEIARDLAYRLYLVCERKKWSQEGQAYNALVVAWPEIQRLVAAEPASAVLPQTSFEV